MDSVRFTTHVRRRVSSTPRMMPTAVAVTAPNIAMVDDITNFPSAVVGAPNCLLPLAAYPTPLRAHGPNAQIQGRDRAILAILGAAFDSL